MLLCQTDTKELCRSTEEGRKFLSVVVLPQFAELNALDIDLNKLKRRTCYLGRLVKGEFCHIINNVTISIMF